MKAEQYRLLRQFEDDFFWFVGMHELVLSFAEKHSTPGRPLNVFDAGCGTGGLLSRLSGTGKASGMDCSEEAVRLCRQRGLENVQQGSLNDWSPPREAYDVITCIDVLSHAGVISDGGVLIKFHEALKSSGLLILNMAAFEILRRKHDEEVDNGKRYRKEDLLRPLQDAGFDVKVMTYRLPLLFPVLFLKKIWPRSGGAGGNAGDIRPLPGILNRSLLQMHRWENRQILKGRGFPFGSSLFAVGQKR